MYKAGRVLSEDAVRKKLEKVYILILESSTQLADLLKAMLEELGFTNIIVAHNGFQGVQILREIKINLIITDWDLRVSRADILEVAEAPPSLDILPLSGLDFVKRLRQSPASPNPFIPVIMFADKVEKTQVVCARDAGVSEICLKPLSAQELCRRILATIQAPRIFITASSYKGPCRRRKPAPLDDQLTERRVREVRIIKNNEKIRAG